MALLDHAWHLRGVRYNYLSIVGSQGAAYVDDHTNMQLLCRHEQMQAIQADDGIAPWTGCIQEFVDLLTADDSITPSKSSTVKNCRAVAAVLRAAEVSIKTKQAVMPEGVQ